MIFLIIFVLIVFWIISLFVGFTIKMPDSMQSYFFDQSFTPL